MDLVLPEVLSRGEVARLIPVVADTSREQRAVSVLLASLMAVDNLSKVLLGGIGQRLGRTANVRCFTEVVLKEFPSATRMQPDGLITVSRGKRTWRALLEAKIGRACLSDEQIKDYLRLAKLNNIDAVITVSNQFAALPTHHPVQLSKNAKKGVELYHWSWMNVLTQAMLLLAEREFAANGQRFVLEEMVRYFEHDSVGVIGFDRMNAEWKDLVVKVQSRAALYKSAPEIVNSVAAWHQESRDLCLHMSRLLARDVSLKLSQAHKRDASRRLRDDSEELIKTATLRLVLEVPDAAAPIAVAADLRGRTVSCAMRLAAPGNKKTAAARINWIVRQLASSDADDLFLTAVWPGGARKTQATLAEVRENPKTLQTENSSLAPGYFEVLMVKDLAGKFSGRRTFIQHIESIVPDYYQRVGQHLRAWVAPPPKPREKEVSMAAEPAPELEKTISGASEMAVAAKVQALPATNPVGGFLAPMRRWYQL